MAHLTGVQSKWKLTKNIESNAEESEQSAKSLEGHINKTQIEESAISNPEFIGKNKNRTESLTAMEATKSDTSNVGNPGDYEINSTGYSMEKQNETYLTSNDGTIIENIRYTGQSFKIKHGEIIEPSILNNRRPCIIYIRSESAKSESSPSNSEQINDKREEHSVINKSTRDSMISANRTANSSAGRLNKVKPCKKDNSSNIAEGQRTEHSTRTPSETQVHETSIPKVKVSGLENYSVKFRIESRAERTTATSAGSSQLNKNSPVYFSSREDNSDVPYSKNIKSSIASSSTESCRDQFHKIDPMEFDHPCVRGVRTKYKRSMSLGHPCVKWPSNESITNTEISKPIIEKETSDITDGDLLAHKPSHAIQSKIFRLNKKETQNEKEVIDGGWFSNSTKDAKSSSLKVQISGKERNPVESSENSNSLKFNSAVGGNLVKSRKPTRFSSRIKGHKSISSSMQNSGKERNPIRSPKKI